MGVLHRGVCIFRKTVTLARLGGQVKIGQKGTKEGLVLAPYSPHSASLSDQPSAEVGPTYCTRGGPVQGEGGKKEYLETLEEGMRSPSSMAKPGSQYRLVR